MPTSVKVYLLYSTYYPIDNRRQLEFSTDVSTWPARWHVDLSPSLELNGNTFDEANNFNEIGVLVKPFKLPPPPSNNFKLNFETPKASIVEEGYASVSSSVNGKSRF